MGVSDREANCFTNNILRGNLRRIVVMVRMHTPILGPISNGIPLNFDFCTISSRILIPFFWPPYLLHFLPLQNWQLIFFFLFAGFHDRRLLKELIWRTHLVTTIVRVICMDAPILRPVSDRISLEIYFTNNLVKNFDLSSSHLDLLGLQVPPYPNLIWVQLFHSLQVSFIEYWLIYFYELEN